MSFKQISCKYGLIGDNLDLKTNINIEINKNGIISKIFCDNIEKGLDINDQKSNLLLIPGLINSHVHIGDSFAKEVGFNKDLIEIVAPPNGIKHKLLKKTPKEVKIEGIKKAALEMLSNGITTFIDFRENSLDGIKLIRKALRDSSIDYLALGRFGNEDEISSVYESADGIGLVTYKQISQQNKEKLQEEKKKKSKIIACHCAEIVRKSDLIDKLVNDNLIDVVIHGTKFTNEDLELIKKNKISLVLCPCCNGYFGVGFPPITDILKLEIPISIGTDNMMANSPDLFEEIRYLHKISRTLDKTQELNAKSLLKMITINAASNFNRENEIGSISEGKIANFFMIDLNNPNFYSHPINYNNVYPLIVQRTKSENIKKVYIKGELVFER